MAYCPSSSVASRMLHTIPKSFLLLHFIFPLKSVLVKNLDFIHYGIDFRTRNIPNNSDFSFIVDTVERQEYTKAGVKLSHSDICDISHFHLINFEM